MSIKSLSLTKWSNTSMADENIAIFIYICSFMNVSANVKQTFPTAAASHLKHLNGEIQLDFHYEVVTGIAMCLSVNLHLMVIWSVWDISGDIEEEGAATVKSCLMKSCRRQAAHLHLLNQLLSMCTAVCRLTEPWKKANYCLVSLLKPQ